MRAFALRPEAIVEPQALSVQLFRQCPNLPLRRAVIVVPSFANFIHDPEQGYFAEGTTEDLIEKGVRALITPMHPSHEL